MVFLLTLMGATLLTFYLILHYKHKQLNKKTTEDKSKYFEKSKETNGGLDKLKPSTIKKEIRYEGKLYDVTEFAERHPGGRVIEFYVNNSEDATLAIQQFHHRSAKKVAGIMKSFKCRDDLNLRLEKSLIINAEDGINNNDKYQQMTQDFTKLYLELEAQGYFKPSKFHITYRISELLLLFSASIYFLLVGNVWTTTIGTIVMGIFIGRIGFLGHEVEHYSFTGNPKIDRRIGTVVHGLGLGMSASWWKSQHNRHHAMPQRLQHDVDLNTTPFFAVNIKVLDDATKANNFFLRNQALFFTPIGSFLVFMNWRLVLHPIYAWKKGQYFELFFMALRLYFLEYLVLGIWCSLAAYAVAGVKMLLNFSLSHTHTPVAEEPRHWLEYSLVHTINIHPSWWCDWWMGYLNYQIEHHLFPSMPNFRQRQISPRVRELAVKHGLHYVCISYWDALKRTYQNLIDVSNEIANK